MIRKRYTIIIFLVLSKRQKKLRYKRQEFLEKSLIDINI